MRARGPLWARSSVRLAVVVVVTATTVLGAASVLELVEGRRQDERSFQTTAQLTLDRLRYDLQYPLWHLERAAVERTTSHEMGSPDVLAVVVRDEHDAPYLGLLRASDGSVRPLGTGETDERLRAAASTVAAGPILERGQRIGSVTLYLTDSRLLAEQHADLVHAIQRLVLLVSALAVVLFLSVQLTLVRPIERLEAWVRGVESGAPVPVTPAAGIAGEVASLARAFGVMAAHQAKSRAQLRGLASRLQRAREEEKTRIARDLHDELGQLLTGLKMDLLWMESRIEAMPPGPETNALLDRAVAAAELSDRTVARVQQIATDLRPAALDRLGLGAALQQEARRFQERTGVPCQALVPEKLPPHGGDAATALYRIAQEALTNVARHARASSVALRLGAEEEALVLTVEDDGEGMDPTEPERPSSLGLLGMKERAVLLGGGVTFARRQPRGSVVTARVQRFTPQDPEEPPA